MPPGQGEAHLAAAMHELVRARQNGTTSILEIVDRHREWLPPGTTAVLLLANPEIDLDHLESTIAGLRAFAARPVAVAVDALAFPPVDRPPTPVEVVREQREALARRLIDLDVTGAVVGPDRPPGGPPSGPGLPRRPARGPLVNALGSVVLYLLAVDAVVCALVAWSAPDAAELVIWVLGIGILHLLGERLGEGFASVDEKRRGEDRGLPRHHPAQRSRADPGPGRGEASPRGCSAS